MYCTVQERFQGAFLGCAIAQEQELADLSLSTVLTNRGQAIEQITFYKTSQLRSVGLPGLVDTVLVSLLCHDSAIERHHALAEQSPISVMLSDAIAARLQSQMPDFSSNTGLARTIEQAIGQQLPLQVAAQSLMSFPDLSSLDQAIALALYCWLCSPQQFTVARGRSNHLPTMFPEHEWIMIVPGITGLLAGASVGIGNLRHHAYPQTDQFQQLGNHIYHIWAGIIEGSPSLCPSDEIVISPLGRLKPRSFEHLSFNSDYD